MPLLDLSKIAKLKDVVFYYNGSTRWITTTVQTINLRSLQQITIDSHHPTPTEIEELDYQEWQDFDHLLAKLWTSHSPKARVQGVGGGGWCKSYYIKVVARANEERGR